MGRDEGLKQVPAYRDDFDDIEGVIRELSIYECVIMEIETKFRVLSTQYGVSHEGNPIESISTRVKTPSSIREKLVKVGLPATFQSMHDNLHDIAGVRIICPFVDDLYALADLFLSQDDVTLLMRKDYIARPKPNGYRSLHLIVETPVFTPQGKKFVKVEIQMRTIAMHFWANLEHSLNYKKDLDVELKADLAEELYECAEASAMLDERMGTVRRKVDACTTLLGTASETQVDVPRGDGARYDAVLFDLDGTLIDTEDLILGSMRYAMSEVLGKTIPDEELISFIGTPLDDQMVHFAGGDKELGATLARVYREHNERVHDERIKKFPGILEVLQAMRSRSIPLGVVTSKRHALAERGMRCCGLTELIDFVIGPDDFPAHKPDPGPVLEGCKRTGALPERCLYVGDSPYDIRAGNAAGCETAAVEWGVFSLEALRCEGPTHVVDSPEALRQLVLGE